MTTKKYTEVLSDSGLVNYTYIEEDGTIIAFPADLTNSDYQAYLATLVTESAPTA